MNATESLETAIPAPLNGRTAAPSLKFRHMAPPRVELLRRTFAALDATDPKERERLNVDTLTSEYYTGKPWLVRVEARMNDGSPNPAQKWHAFIYRTRAAAQLHRSAEMHAAKERAAKWSRGELA